MLRNCCVSEAPVLKCVQNILYMYVCVHELLIMPQRFLIFFTNFFILCRICLDSIQNYYSLKNFFLRNQMFLTKQKQRTNTNMFTLQRKKTKKNQCDMYLIFFRNRIDKLVLTNVISQVKKPKRSIIFLTQNFRSQYFL